MEKIELVLTADPSQAKRGVAALRSEYEKFAREVERPLSGIDTLRSLQESAKAASAEYFSARRRLQGLKDAAANATTPVRGLAQEIGKAEGKLARATREFERQKAAVNSQRAELKAAGVDTRNLSSEQQRLQAEMAKFRTDTARSGIARLAAEQKRAQVAARDLSLQQARSNLGVTQARTAQQTIADLRRQYELLRSSGTLTTRELAIAQEQLNAKIAQAKGELRGLQGGGSGGGIAGLAARGGGALAAAGGIAGLALAGRAYAKALDPIKKMEAQLKLATSSQDEFNRAQEETFRLSQENQAPLEDVVGLYARLAPALKEAGRTQGDALKIIDAVTKSLRISGASAEETASTIQQFSQALGSGVLRGEEFNTLAESSPRLLKALADGLNVNVGALRNMAAEGKLTANVIADALVGQLPKLAEEAAMLPETYSGAVTKLANENTLLLKSLDELTGASDKAVGGVNALATAIAKVRAGELVDSFRSQAKGAGGIKNEMSVLLSQIRDLQTARAGLSRTDSTDTFFFKFKFYDRAEADAAIKALEGDLEKLKARLREVEGAEKESNAKREQEEKAASENRRKLKEQAYQDDKKLLEQSLKDAKVSLAARVAEERKAASALEKLQQEKLDTQTRYQDALAKLQSGGAGSDPSYGAASAMKVAARNALQAGDVEGAKRQAQAALAIIQQLAESGQNTYGFEGFVKDLQAIEQAADQKGITEAQAKLDMAKASVAELQAQVDKLSKAKVTPEMSAEDRTKLLTDIQELAKTLGTLLTIPVTPVVTAPSAPAVENSDVPKLATGGLVRGPGTATSDSIWARLSNGEGVINAMAVRHYGAGLIHQLNSLSVPKFAQGGVLGSLPVIPPMAAKPAGAQLADYGSLTMVLPGGTQVPTLVQDSTHQLLRREARMRGKGAPRPR